MADGGGGVQVAAEVTSFKGEVGGDEDLGAGGWLEDGAVVTDSQGEAATMSPAAEGLADVLDEVEFPRDPGGLASESHRWEQDTA